jgi:hypothetical protein
VADFFSLSRVAVSQQSLSCPSARVATSSWFETALSQIPSSTSCLLLTNGRGDLQHEGRMRATPLRRPKRRRSGLFTTMKMMIETTAAVPHAQDYKRPLAGMKRRLNLNWRTRTKMTAKIQGKKTTTERRKRELRRRREEGEEGSKAEDDEGSAVKERRLADKLPSLEEIMEEAREKGQQREDGRRAGGRHS